MDQSVVEAILHMQQVAYVLADRHLVAIESSGVEQIGRGFFILPSGTALAESIPELVGSESVIGEIITGSLPELVIEHMNRPQRDGSNAYFTLRIRAYRGPSSAELLLLLIDTTEQGRQLQQLIQSRNQLQLLTDELEQRNIALLIANNELRRVDEMKSNFVAVAAHELRNPLTPVLGYLELLLDNESGPLNDEQRSTLDIMLKNVLRLRTITSDLLDLARIEAGRVELVLRPTDLHTLVGMVCLEYQPQLNTRQQQLNLVLDAVPLALCDETRAVQIINNLLSNASKYTPQGGCITIWVGLGDEGFVQIRVEDTGIGISEDDKPHLFNAFFRARAATAQGVSGTGLGLHITRLLVELHGGRIWFRSAAGQGSSFFVTFAISDEIAPVPHDRNLVALSH